MFHHLILYLLDSIVAIYQKKKKKKKILKSCHAKIFKEITLFPSFLTRFINHMKTFWYSVKKMKNNEMFFR